MQFSYLSYSKNRVFDFICLWLLPIGFLLLLSDLYFLPGRSIHHKLYYGLFSIPTLIAIILRPRELKDILREPLVLGFILLSLWSIFSLIWSNTQDDFVGLVRPALHMLMLYFGCSLLVKYRADILQPLFFSAAIIALIATLYNLWVFIPNYSPEARMIGAGAFDNPLLSSHAFGFFCIYWLALGMTCKRAYVLLIAAPAFLIMFAAILATGSRTPLVAVVLAMVWLSFICWNRRSLALISMLVVGGIVVMTMFSEMILGRGSSFRIELWQMALALIEQRPWIGYGYDAALSLQLPGTDELLSEPHNFAVLRWHFRLPALAVHAGLGAVQQLASSCAAAVYPGFRLAGVWHWCGPDRRRRINAKAERTLVPAVDSSGRDCCAQYQSAPQDPARQSG